MEKKGQGHGKITKKVRLFLSLEPPRVIEGKVTLPSPGPDCPIYSMTSDPI